MEKNESTPSYCNGPHSGIALTNVDMHQSLSPGGVGVLPPQTHAQSCPPPSSDGLLRAAPMTMTQYQLPFPVLSSNAQENFQLYQLMKQRRGKWLPEEEEYANFVIEEFESGLSPNCENGFTLRAYLSRKLYCSPMRISKKYAGKRVGKQVFLCKLNGPAAHQLMPQILRNRKKGVELEQKFIQAIINEELRIRSKKEKQAKQPQLFQAAGLIHPCLHSFPQAIHHTQFPTSFYEGIPLSEAHINPQVNSNTIQHPQYMGRLTPYQHTMHTFVDGGGIQQANGKMHNSQVTIEQTKAQLARNLDDNAAKAPQVNVPLINGRQIIQNQLVSLTDPRNLNEQHHLPKPSVSFKDNPGTNQLIFTTSNTQQSCSLPREIIQNGGNRTEPIPAVSNRVGGDADIPDLLSGFDKHVASMKGSNTDISAVLENRPMCTSWPEDSHFFAGSIGHESPYITSKSFDELHRCLGKGISSTKLSHFDLSGIGDNNEPKEGNEDKIITNQRTDTDLADPKIMPLPDQNSIVSTDLLKTFGGHIHANKLYQDNFPALGNTLVSTMPQTSKILGGPSIKPNHQELACNVTPQCGQNSGDIYLLRSVKNEESPEFNISPAPDIVGVSKREFLQPNKRPSLALGGREEDYTTLNSSKVGELPRMGNYFLQLNDQERRKRFKPSSDPTFLHPVSGSERSSDAGFESEAKSSKSELSNSRFNVETENNVNLSSDCSDVPSD